MTDARAPAYFTTPIYYVNDRPHIGHCYTTLVADVAARAARLIGGPKRDVFFLTGTDEHAEKVVTSALAHDMTPQQWADTNAQRFIDAFAFMGFSNDDFIRTSEDRHKTRASAMIKQLMDQGDIELGDYKGWFDPSQEEYLTETVAKEHNYTSPVTGRPLEERTEQNYFFNLPKYEDWLRNKIETDRIRVLPEARKNEVLGRIKTGLQRVPVSRRIKDDDAAPDWGITMPGDPAHRVYVWIEALCNYRTAIDTDDRRKFWPSGAEAENTEIAKPISVAQEGGGNGAGTVTHFMAKDILWFHAVIWPAMLHALGLEPPTTVYAHAYWIAEGRKMSKSLGNFIEIDQLKAYADRYSLDAVRWYLMTQGPLGATDADFAHARFIDVYNSDLANGIGNSTSRVSNMIEKYFGGQVPQSASKAFLTTDGSGADGESGSISEKMLAEVAACSNQWSASLNYATALNGGPQIVQLIDGYIAKTRPFSIAKDLDGTPVFSGLSNSESLATILYQCAEALRIASLFFYPAMPAKMADLWRKWNCDHLIDPADHNSGFKAPLAELAQFGDGPYSLKPGQRIDKGEALFMRADPAEAAP